MSIEDKIRLELHNQSRSIKTPAELKQRVRQSYEMLYGKKEEKAVKRMKWLPAAVLAAALLLPTGVLAYNYADSIFGSFEKLKKKVSVMTLQTYQKVGLKLSDAHQTLGDQEFANFEKLLKTYTAVTYDYLDENGHVNFDLMPAEQRSEAKRILVELTPYFDQLNNHKSSREVLTPEEFDRYIEAEMTLNTVKAIAGIKDSPDIRAEDLPEDVWERYAAAKRIIDEVHKKIAQPGPDITD
jgi:hypothetical protein